MTPIHKVALGTAAYLFISFPLAILWHIVLFEAQYQAFNYIEGEPRLVLGFLAIMIQGLVLSALYPRVRLSGVSVVRGLKYAAIIGVFFWTSHVLAFVAKQPVGEPLLFIAIESVYLSIQFGVYGVLIGLIYGK